MAGSEDRTYTEVEHVTLMAAAVSRENADIEAVKVELETKVSELAAKVEVLEAEKATLSTQVEAAEKAHADFKTEVERTAEIAALKSERAAAIKAANPALPDTHFTDERILAWAELNAETFEVVLDGIKATASVAPGAARETAAFKAGAPVGAPAGKNVAGRFLTVGKD